MGSDAGSGVGPATGLAAAAVAVDLVGISPRKSLRSIGAGKSEYDRLRGRFAGGSSLERRRGGDAASAAAAGDASTGLVR